MEKVLDRIRETWIPEASRDLNLEIFYADESDPREIVNRALSFPFLSEHRLIIVRRMDLYRADALEKFLPYLENPPKTSCLIFVAQKPDFKRKFYRTIRSLGGAVLFPALRENQVVPWIRSLASEMGLNIEKEACDYLQQMVGANPRELHAELEKLFLRYGGGRVGMEEVRELAIHSRLYSVFELMNLFSTKNGPAALRVLSRFLEEEDKKGGPLRLLGMLNRQVRLLWQTKMILQRGGQAGEVAQRLSLPRFSAGNLVRQAKYWSLEELERTLRLLYEVDGRLKSGSRPKPVLENFFLALCTPKSGPRGR